MTTLEKVSEIGMGGKCDASTQTEEIVSETLHRWISISESTGVYVGLSGCDTRYGFPVDKKLVKKAFNKRHFHKRPTKTLQCWEKLYRRNTHSILPWTNVMSFRFFVDAKDASEKCLDDFDYASPEEFFWMTVQVLSTSESTKPTVAMVIEGLRFLMQKIDGLKKNILELDVSETLRVRFRTTLFDDPDDLNDYEGYELMVEAEAAYDPGSNPREPHKCDHVIFQISDHAEKYEWTESACKCCLCSGVCVKNILRSLIGILRKQTKV